MMYLLQYFAGAFALFALSRVILRAKERKMTWGELGFWGSLWVAMIVFIFSPGISTSIADIFGIGRGVDLVLYAAIILVFYLVFRIYVKVEQLEQEVTTMVREIALRDLPKKKK